MPGQTATMTAATSPATPMKRQALPGPAILLVLGSCSSLQAGAALAMRLFPVLGAPGATLLRVGLAAIVLLAVTRPRVGGWRRRQWQAGAAYGGRIARGDARFD